MILVLSPKTFMASQVINDAWEAESRMAFTCTSLPSFSYSFILVVGIIASQHYYRLWIHFTAMQWVMRFFGLIALEVWPTLAWCLFKHILHSPLFFAKMKFDLPMAKFWKFWQYKLSDHLTYNNGIPVSLQKVSYTVIYLRLCSDVLLELIHLCHLDIYFTNKNPH